MRCEPELAEGGDVVLDRDPLLRTGHQRGVDRFGQPLLGPALGLQDRLEPLVAHRVTLSQNGGPTPRASPTEPPGPGNTNGTDGRARGKSHRRRVDAPRSREASPAGKGDHPPAKWFPASTSSTTPVIWRASSESRNAAAAAMSSASVSRPRTNLLPASRPSSASHIALVPEVLVSPGLTAFTRTPRGPRSAAIVRVSALRAALAAA